MSVVARHMNLRKHKPAVGLCGGVGKGSANSENLAAVEVVVSYGEYGKIITVEVLIAGV